MSQTDKVESNDRSEAAMLACDRAAYEFRRGRIVRVEGDGDSVLAVAAEMLSPQALDRIRSLAGADPDIAITHNRARTLKIPLYTDEIVRIPFSAWKDAATARTLGDPTKDLANPMRGPYTPRREPVGSAALAAVQLAKVARLLPTAVMVSAAAVDEGALEAAGIATVTADAIMEYEMDTAGSLVQVTAARVPLEDAEDARMFAFRSPEGGREHLAIVVGEPPTDKPVLARLHSECFTGDLIGSLKCDCGQQLRGALAQIGQEGAGVLLYLRQEGRGIGLINKLRAYALQGQGFDTVEANERLGFESDERVFLPAARILERLGYRQVRLMTNNPDKVEALEEFGIDVVERVPHAFPSNDHNEFYLSVKKEKSGHLL